MMAYIIGIALVLIILFTVRRVEKRGKNVKI